MARLDSTSPLKVLGSIDKLSIYKRRDLDKIIVRAKGGPTKEQIKTLEQFETTRRINVEFGGRSLASRWIMLALHLQKELGDYNIAGPLNSLLRSTQHIDSKNEMGQRSVLLSQQPNLLTGFDFNRKRTFNSIVRMPLHYTLSHDPVQATIDIPALLPGMTLQTPGNYPLYSFIAQMGVVPDLEYSEYGYRPNDLERGEYPKTAYSDWYPVLNGSAATSLQLSFDKPAIWTAYTVILSIGIRFGTIGADGNVQQVKYAGAAKILATA